MSEEKKEEKKPSFMRRLMHGLKPGSTSGSSSGSSSGSTSGAVVPSGPTCECSQHGWLTKNQKNRRWFALVGSDLYWFEKQDCDVHGKRATRWLPLGGDAVCARYGKRSIIVRSEGRQLILSAAEGTAVGEASEDEVINEWLEKLKAAVNAQKTAIGDDDLARVHKTGFLTCKKNHNYYVLRERYLAWFKTDKSNKPLGKIMLGGAELDRKSSTSVVITRQGQSMELLMTSSREADEWFAALQKAVEAQNHREECDAEALSKIAEVAPINVDVSANGVVYPAAGNTFESAQTIKERVVKMVYAAQEETQGPPTQMLIDSYFLKVATVNIFLVPEHVPLKQLPVFILCSRTLSVPTLELVSKQKLREDGIDLRELADTTQTTELISRSRAIEEKRETLMGQHYTSLLAKQTLSANRDPEFLPSRLALLKYIGDAQSQITVDAKNSHFPQFIGTEPMPHEVPERVYVSCTLPRETFKTLDVASSIIPSELLKQFHRGFLQKCGLPEVQFPLSDYVLKVAGRRSYLIDDVPIISYDYVRHCINHNVRIELAMVRPSAISDADPQVDDFLFRITRVHADPPRRPLPEVSALTPIPGALVPAPAPAPGEPEKPPVQKMSIGSSVLRRKFRVRFGQFSVKQPDVVEKLIDFSTNSIDVSIRVSAELLHGVTHISSVGTTTWVPYKYALRGPDDVPKIVLDLDQWITLDTNISDLPPETALRIVVSAWSKNNGDSDNATRSPSPVSPVSPVNPTATQPAAAPGTPDQPGTVEELGWLNYMVYGSDMWMRNSARKIALWPGATPNYIGTCCENIFVNCAQKNEAGEVAGTGEFLDIALEGCGDFGCDPWDIFYDRKNPFAGENQAPPAPIVSGGNPSSDLCKIMDIDRGHPLTPEECMNVQYHRDELPKYPQFLKIFLLSVDWRKWSQVVEARRLLGQWAPPTPETGLQLLDWRLADDSVRRYAVSLIDKMPDGELANFLVQLVGVVQYEPRHDSALAKLLLRRALANHAVIGHQFFWLLRAEAEAAVKSMNSSNAGRLVRLGMLQDAFLRGCTTEAVLFLYKEVEMMKGFATVATAVKGAAKEERTDVMKYQLRRLNMGTRFEIPLFSDRECSGLVLNSCRFMKSKKLPLWLVFNNADATGEETLVLYKLGDDLRQDVLTLQLLRLMDNTWIGQEGLDLKMRPYGVIATGDQEGLVEIVTHAETIGGINRWAGGTVAVLKPDVLARWLQTQNPDPDSYKQAVRNFALSCAGYCVATYVLGIADRHNDNIMICEDGRLFHIDFGHILGHFKTKMGVKRERAPLIFTPQMAHVLGGLGSEAYTLFQNRAVQAFLILRHNAELFTTVLNLALCCDLPEVQTALDVLWVRQHLHLEMSDPEASTFFLNLIEESLHTVSTQLMDMIHILAN